MMKHNYLTLTDIPHTGLKKITLKNDFLEVVLLNYGARLHQLFMPNQKNRWENILLSYDSYQDVLNDQSFFGATVGPVAGRIRNGHWQNGTLEQNHGPHHIHGGSNGWSFQFWKVVPFEENDIIGVTFHLNDTFSGYPGPINATITYQLQDNNLRMTSSGISAKETLFNPTNHAYFNLSGNGKTDILSHSLSLNCQGMLELDDEKLPTGRILPISELPINFNQLTTIERILQQYPNGLDDVFRLSHSNLKHPQLSLQEPTSGREMTIATTNQSVVLFSTTGFEAPFHINGQSMHSNYGLAIEPQECPDLVHFPQWGSILLSAEQQQTYQTIYQFNLL
jgi:aldose 1-epimerase